MLFIYLLTYFFAVHHWFLNIFFVRFFCLFCFCCKAFLSIFQQGSAFLTPLSENLLVLTSFLNGDLKTESEVRSFSLSASWWCQFIVSWSLLKLVDISHWLDCYFVINPCLYFLLSCCSAVTPWCVCVWVLFTDPARHLAGFLNLTHFAPGF